MRDDNTFQYVYHALGEIWNLEDDKLDKKAISILKKFVTNEVIAALIDSRVRKYYESLAKEKFKDNE